MDNTFFIGNVWTVRVTVRIFHPVTNWPVNVKMDASTIGLEIFVKVFFFIDEMIRCWRSISKGSKEICQKRVDILIQVNKILSVCSLNSKWPNVLPHMLVSVYFMGFIVLHVILTITTCVYNWAILFWYIPSMSYFRALITILVPHSIHIYESFHQPRADKG